MTDILCCIALLAIFTPIYVKLALVVQSWALDKVMSFPQEWE